MDTRAGIFIVIEGSDGSGKKTQFELLSARLRAAGYGVDEFDFPRYNHESSHFVRKYLAGEYGDSDTINPYTASMFYALDRYEAAFDIRASLNAGRIVIANRYVGSNMAHQGSKFGSEGEKRGFFMWEDSLEFQLLGIPRPDLNIFLKVPALVSQKLIIKRSESTGRPLDEHEKDIDHLSRSVASYELLCRLFPKDYLMVECTRLDELLPVKTISDFLWQTIQPRLLNITKGQPGPRIHNISSKPKKASAVEPSTITTEPQPQMTFLEILRSGGFSIPSTSAKRLNFETTRETENILDNYREERLKLENRLVTFEKKFEQKLAGHELTAKRTHTVKQQVLRSLQPRYCLSVMSTAIKREQPQIPGQQLTRQLEGLSKSIASYQPTGQEDKDLVNLVNAQPRNELDLLSHALFSLNVADVKNVSTGLFDSDFDLKEKALKHILSSADTTVGRAVYGAASYTFQVNCSLDQFDRLLGRCLPRCVTSQVLTPMNGYSIPSIVDRLGLAEEYSECFDASVNLFSRIQAGHGEANAAYALLGGHSQRFLIGVDLHSLTDLAISLHAIKNTSGFIKTTTKGITRAIQEIHPIIGEYLVSLSIGKKTKSN